MTPEGRIVIDLFPDRSAADIASSRPLTLTRTFTGRRAEDVLRSVPMVFAACRAAQSIASAEAFEDALRIAPPRSTRTVRRALILAETAREHALRILMDWPKFLSAEEAPQAALLKKLMRNSRELACKLDENGDAARLGGQCAVPSNEALAAIGELRAILEEGVFGENLDGWLERSDSPALERWAFAGRTVAQRLVGDLLREGLTAVGAASVAALPPTPAGVLAERLFADDADGFIAEPDWQGQACETSPLARYLHHPLVVALKDEAGFGVGARLVASLAELADIPAQMVALLERHGEDAPSEPNRASSGGIGIAQVEAARGRLVHGLRMAGDRVGRYSILAPTEWNFHPRGAAARGLARIAASGGDRCAFLAGLFVTAVDPCVGYEVRMR